MAEELVAGTGLSPTQRVVRAALLRILAVACGLAVSATPSLASGEDTLPDDGGVTYAQVLADPDNIELGYHYAIKQIKRDDLLGASATLDRLILLAPGEPNIRALRAIVLFRLDNLREARNEFSSLLEQELDPALRQAIQRYATELDRRSKSTRIDLLTSLGYQFDSNRAGVPTSGQVQTFIGNFDVDETGNEGADSSLTGFARFGIEHDLATEGRNTLFGSVSLYDANQFRLDDYDTANLGVEAGGRFEFGEIMLTPRLAYDHLFLGGDSYLDTYGASVRADLRINDPVNLWAQGEVARLDYRNTTLYPTGDLQTGTDAGLTLGTDIYAGTNHRLTASFTHHYFGSRQDWETFTGERINLTHTWLIGGGAFLLTNLSGEYTNYDMADPFTGTDDRHDWIYRARMTLGVPVQTMFAAEDWPAALDGLVFTVYGEYYREESNIINYDFDNIRAGATLSKRWEF